MCTRRMAAAIVLAAIACDRSPTASPPALQDPRSPSPTFAAATSQSDDQRTPFQRSLAEAIAARQAQGLPVPAEVSYQYAETAPPAAVAPGPAGAAQAGGVTIVARTVIRFESVEQAGMAEWPALVVSGEVPEGATGYIRPGDYTQFAKDEIAKKYPDAWSTVSYETGPRVYSVAETLTVEGARQADQLMRVQLEGLEAVTALDRLLLGFTLQGPGIDYHVDWDVGICLVWFFGCRVEIELASFWAGFVLDWTIGMRLPMGLNVATPTALTEGGALPLASAASGQDWHASDFESVGVSPEDGNEYVLRFAFGAGVFLSVVGYDAVNIGVQPMELDAAASFATPLGPGQMLTLPDLGVPLWGFNAVVANANIALGLTPRVGSDHFVADWLAAAEASGGGSASYTTSGLTVPLGNVLALDGPGTAALQLSGFRYYFSQFELDLGVNFTFHVLGFGDTYQVPVGDFDLSDIMGGLFVGPHEGTAGTLGIELPIENVAPTVGIAVDGAVLVNGVPTWLARPGRLLAFTGEASDPGRDDLTLTWDWGDGPPAPDQTTTYPVPHVVTESRDHAFDNACLYAVTLVAVDDDQAVGEARLPVVVTGGAGVRSRLEGYWQHQFGRNGRTEFTDAELECYLGIVGHMSAVFGEGRAVTTLDQAHDILHPAQNADDPRELLDRELLVAWLTFAAGGIGYSQLVDGSGDGAADTPFGAAMAAVEAARVAPATTPRALRRLAQIVHAISVKPLS